VSLLKELPQLNYAAVIGVIKKRKGINLTPSGSPVIHLLVESIAEAYPGGEETAVYEIQIDVWGKLATNLNERLTENTGILAEGIIVHKQIEDGLGGMHFQNILRARRIDILAVRKTERKA
jgi:primosomal replication protein N